MADEIEIQEQGMIDFKCPHCGENGSFPEMDAGMALDCPFCGQVLIVPKANGQSAKKFPVPFTTPRLVLRRLRRDDDAALMRLFGEKVDGNPGLQPLTEEEILRWIETDSHTNLSQLQPDLSLVIERQEDSRVIGVAVVKYGNDAFQQPVFNVTIERAERRKGFGSETVLGLLEFGFFGLNMRRMTAHCDSQNKAFRGLAAKVGLRQEGEFYGDRIVNDEWANTVYFALLQEEFKGAAR